MIIFSRPETLPYFNIAAEELMLKHYNEDCFAIWRNEPCVIVGKHQNTLAEINQQYTSAFNIPVIRRLSGGGAVFHDLGNICFTFVKNIKDNENTDFTEFTKPIIELLVQLGVDAKFEGRNDLTIDNKKFSGSAKCIYKNRILFHGTLLFSSAITDLSQALNVDEKKFNDKAVKSVRSRVTNISEHLPQPMAIQDFMNKLNNYILQKYPDAAFKCFDENDIMLINDLMKKRYNNRAWNFGASPKYTFNKSIRTKNAGTISSYIDIEDGKISAVKFHGDFFCNSPVEELESALCGVDYEKEAITNFINNKDLQEYFINIEKEEFFEVLFG